ncbi:hypothetical protein CC2G_011603 [Coprinopsis cinerea AmutBmut pab1-1]|nr:hypothetical protein CC2G_011603 [Coprinopsis cinerea AmutBmut pab1-1]
MALLSNRSPHHASTDASRPLIFSKQQVAKETEFLFRRSARRISSGAGLQSIEELNIPTCNITVPTTAKVIDLDLDSSDPGARKTLQGFVVLDIPMADPATGPNLVLLGGPLYIGSLLAYLLYGAFVVQTVTYLSERPAKASWVGAAVVALVAIVETLSIGFITQTGWHSLVLALNNQESTDRLLKYPEATVANPMLNGLAAWLVQLCFAYRIWILASTMIGKSAAVLVTLGRNVVESTNDPVTQRAVAAYLSITVICDILITIAMISILTTFTATKRLLNTLTVHTIENGLITTLCATVNLILYFARPDDAIHIAFQFIIGRLHANVLMAYLNHRHTNEAGTFGTVDLSGGTHSFHRRRATTMGTAADFSDPPLEFTVISSRGPAETAGIHEITRSRKSRGGELLQDSSDSLSDTKQQFSVM